MKQIIKRLKAETPSFFKKIRWMATSVVALGTTLGALDEKYTYFLPKNTIPMLITVGTIVVFVSSLVTKEPIKQEEK